LQLEADAGGLQRTPANEILKRVVAEQAEVTWTAAGADAGQHWNAAPANAPLSELIEVGRAGGFELGQSAGLLWQTAEPVGDVQDDLAFVLDVQVARELMEVPGRGRCRVSGVGCREFIVAKMGMAARA
jgi:hypothetical protein